jgi:DtxR family Mn-dependent transcriptional regulator
MVIAIWLFRSHIANFFQRFGTGRDSERILCEDALKYIYNCELEGESPNLRGLAGQLNVTVDSAAELLSRLKQRTLIRLKDQSFHLTPAGNDYASHVIRAHRLWERYLADETGVAEVEWHGRAEKLEHDLSRAEADELWARLGHPTHDPHGDPLPTSRGSFDSLRGVSLLNAEPGQRARVIHVEDEPESVYAKLVALGIFPGMELRVLNTEPDRVRILLEGSEKELDALEAANVTLGPYSEQETDFASMSRLSELKVGEKGEVTLISRASRGSERRRFMDLGVLPGTMIAAELESPGGDPVAYRVRGALLALRRDQAEHILISRVENGDS